MDYFVCCLEFWRYVVECNNFWLPWIKLGLSGIHTSSIRLFSRLIRHRFGQKGKLPLHLHTSCSVWVSILPLHLHTSCSVWVSILPLHLHTSCSVWVSILPLHLHFLLSVGFYTASPSTLLAQCGFLYIEMSFRALYVACGNGSRSLREPSGHDCFAPQRIKTNTVVCFQNHYKF